MTLLTLVGRMLRTISTGVDGADASLETAAREDRDAERTDSHERPSKCT
jgi:hypothetical protein